MTLICNGEIYNFKRLGEQYDFQYETSCDVEAIIQLYGKFGITKAAQHLDGVFAFALIDKEKHRVYFVRDPYGVRPLFRLENADDVVAVCSEAKGKNLSFNFDVFGVINLSVLNKICAETENCYL